MSVNFFRPLNVKRNLEIKLISVVKMWIVSALMNRGNKSAR